ncbi:MAG: ribosomal protein S18-alanine N-acetyltransferase [Nitrospirae bacterium]|nr:ribosomal protein S18-alanine N-acetyltransferase [Nitrospirota bacterium]
MNAVAIREMSTDDMPQVLEIENSSYTMPWSETSFLSEIYSRHSITRVAEFDGKIVSYICIKKVSDEGHLLNLTVHPDYRRRGIARMLFNDALGDLLANDCRFMYLEVRVSNNGAIKMYTDMDFKVVGTRKDYYIRPTENALIMMLELKKDEKVSTL